MDTASNLTILRVPLSALHVDSANARQHGERNLDSIRASLMRFGQAEPLVVHKGTGPARGGFTWPPWTSGRGRPIAQDAFHGLQGLLADDDLEVGDELIDEGAELGGLHGLWSSDPGKWNQARALE